MAWRARMTRVEMALRHGGAASKWRGAGGAGWIAPAHAWHGMAIVGAPTLDGNPLPPLPLNLCQT